jgi:hypothetical protein
MLRRVALVRTDVLKERIASIIGVTRIGKLGTTLAVGRNETVNVIRMLVTANVARSSFGCSIQTLTLVHRFLPPS